jgi:hypothetical protein
MLRDALLCVLVAGAVGLSAQSFEAPFQLKAGESYIGHQLDDRDRLYPSPALFDITGDGKLEIVIGDLRGFLTYATRTEDGWSEEKPLMATDGKPLRFHNW